MNTPAACTVRAMAAADVPAALALWHATEGMGLTPEETPAMVTAFLGRNPGLGAVALSPDGTLVGAIMAGHDGRRGFLYHLAVAPDWRGRGLGRRLAEFSLSGLHAAGIAKACILVYAANDTGRAFWRKLGWITRDDVVLMQTQP